MAGYLGYKLSKVRAEAARVDARARLRDEFAMAALTGILAFHGSGVTDWAARRAYEEADKMLAVHDGRRV